MSSATSTAVLPHLNGDGITSPDVSREATFLEKLLQIRDEVLASKHPRIQLPTKILEQVVPRATQSTPPIVSGPTVNGMPKGTQLHLFPPRPQNTLQPTPEYSASTHNTLRPFPAKPASSGIDPVLLEKSPHLIKAELQLQRQHIERALKDHFDKKGRGSEALVDEREARFDVDDILTKAHTIVKPVSGLQLTAINSEGSESFDENSYYSSQANSWSSEEVDPNHNLPAASAADPLTQQAQLTAAKPASHPSVQNPAAIELDLEDDLYEPADDIEIYEPDPTKVREDLEESDYSPPPADIIPSEPNKGRVHDRRVDNTSGTNGSSRRQSPAGNPPPLQNPRKRRREEKREERRRQQANKRVVRSPEPYIKEEPQSPPPLPSYPDAQPSKRRALQPLPHDVEVVSARESRIPPVYYREQDNSPRSHRPYDEPLSPSVVRLPQRRPERDDQDLRRVASVQYARRPYSPTGPEPYLVPENRQMRAASHAYAERPVEHVFRETSARPSAAPRYVRERSRSPGHEYLSRGQSPVAMAPPRRIVMDQYGNKYYAAPVDLRESAAPPSRRIDAEPYYDRAITREPTIRAPARSELYDDDNLDRMPPPPPPPPRRYVEASEVEVVETRPFRQRETSHRPMDMDYPPRQVVERRPLVQYEEMAPPREYVPTRAYSMRPETVRRDMPPEYAPVRHESVQPGYVRVAAPRYREVSIVQQEPYDDRQYTYATPQLRRYADEEAAERPLQIVQEPYGAEGRRVSYRY